ncbi:UNVERIFIED_ORG: hypothetical protein GGD59_003272 [Rhizobium esperanzae]
MNTSASITVEILGRTVPVLGLSSGGLTVPMVQDIIGYSGVARVVIFRGELAWKGDVSVQAEQAGEKIDLTLTGGREEYRRLLSVLNWYTGRNVFYAEQFADTAPPEARDGSGGLRKGARLAGLGLVALGLIALIFHLSTQRSMSATSQIAYVAVPGKELDSRSAGQVVYVKGAGKVDKGELFAALKTSRDYAKFLEASSSGDISAQAATAQDYVRRGTPVVRLSDKGAKPYVAAFVKLADAVTALKAAEAQIEFPRSGRTFSVPIEARSYVNNTKVFTDEDGKALAEINLKMPDGLDIPVDEPVVVKFQRPVWSPSAVSPRWLKTISSLLS